MIKNNRKRRKLLTENSDEVVKVILKKYGLNHGRFIINKYKSHPLYPGFKAISYIMEANGIESCLIKTDINELGQLPMPIIIEYDGLFLPIGDVKEKNELAFLMKEARWSMNRYLCLKVYGQGLQWFSMRIT